jgi:hypothetical protein
MVYHVHQHFAGNGTNCELCSSFISIVIISRIMRFLGLFEYFGTLGTLVAVHAQQYTYNQSYTDSLIAVLRNQLVHSPLEVAPVSTMVKALILAAGAT